MPQDVFRNALRAIMELEDSGPGGIEADLNDIVTIAADVLAQYDSIWFENYKLRMKNRTLRKG